MYPSFFQVENSSINSKSPSLRIKVTSYNLLLCSTGAPVSLMLKFTFLCYFTIFPYYRFHFQMSAYLVCKKIVWSLNIQFICNNSTICIKCHFILWTFFSSPFLTDTMKINSISEVRSF